MDIAQLSQLPIAVLAMLGAYWAIQRNDAAYQKKLIELIGQFSEKYIELLNGAKEARDESRQRWLERDRILIATLVSVEKSLVENAKETHNLRTTLSPLVTWWQIERAKQQHSTTRGAGESGEGDNAAG